MKRKQVQLLVTVSYPEKFDFDCPMTLQKVKQYLRHYVEVGSRHDNDLKIKKIERPTRKAEGRK